MGTTLHFGRTSAAVFISGIVVAAAVGSGCDSSASNSSTGTCATGEKRCSCFSNDTCNDGLVCISDVCVDAAGNSSGGQSGTGTEPGPLGGQNNGEGGGAQAAGGAGQTTSNGGATVTGNGGATVTGNGGATVTGNGGATVTGNGGATVTGNGGATVTGNGGATVTGSGGSTVTNNSPVIDAFASCDEQIEPNSGRSGKWYYFADSDFNATRAFGDPGTQWVDHSCAAWMILGCTGTACTYAGLGFQLAGGNPYDLSSYQGISIAFEGKDNVYFVVKTSDGGYFGTWLTGTSGNQTRNADFSLLAPMANSAVSTLNTRLITEMQFTVGKALALNGGFGLAIHSVSLR